jgi:VWFA-related protein
MKSKSLIALLGWFVIAMPLVGQAPKPDAVPDSGAVIRTETKVVLVDTVVTDKKGNYVRNLTAKDFKVWEDNKQQEIRTFTFQADPSSPANGRRRYIVLFFDNSTLDFALQAQARQAAAKFIDANAAPDRMMSVVNFGGALQIAQNFTADTARLKQVVSGARIAAVNSNETGTGADAQISKAAASFGARDMLLALRGLAKDLNAVPGRKTLILFTAGFPLNAERISEATATIESCNRSNVAIYPIDVRGLASGVPVAELMNSAPTRSSSALFSRVALGFNPISPSMSFFQRGGAAPGGGPVGGGRGGAPTGGAPGGGRPAPAPTPAPTPAPNPGAGRGPVGQGPRNPGLNGRGGMPGQPPFGPQSQARSVILPKMPESMVDAQNIMHMLADGTGGFVIKNTNDLFAGMQKIGTELDEYYVLGYTPPESQEGSCHALKVKVDQGGTQVRARTGYCNARARDVLAGNPIEKTLESRAAGSQPGTVPASLQLPYFYTASNVARVNVAIEIPSDVMKFEKQKGKFHAQLDILGIAYNPDGSTAARFSDTVKREFEDKKEVEAFEKAPLHYENQFDIGAGRYKFKLVFGEGGNSNFGKLELPLEIEPYDSANFGVSGLALSKQVQKEAELALTLDQTLLEDRVPLVSAGIQVIPAGSPKFTKGGTALFYAEIYEPQFLNAELKDKPVVGIQMRILDRKTGEQKYTSGLMRLDVPDQKGNPVITLAERLPIENVGPGQYTLEVQAVDTSDKPVKRTADFDLE